MKFNPDIHHRHSIRLKQYDYSKEGLYLITICTQNREKILSVIETNNVGAGPVSAQKTKNKLNVNIEPCIVYSRNRITKLGKMIKSAYINLYREFKNIKLHDYVIMPNHIHGIIEICSRADTGPAPTIGDIICSFKTRTTGLCIKGINNGMYKPFNKRLWQRNYYEHIIRSEKEYLQIQQYVQNNPLNWGNDKFNY